MPQSHFSSIEMKEVHKLHRLAFTKSSEIDSFGLIVQLELDRVYLDMFYLSADLAHVRSDVQLTEERIGGGRFLGCWCFARGYRE